MDLNNREDAIRVIEEASEAYIAQNHRAPRAIITVGGTAMATRRLRERSQDIDLFHPLIRPSAQSHWTWRHEHTSNSM